MCALECMKILKVINASKSNIAFLIFIFRCLAINVAYKTFKQIELENIFYIFFLNYRQRSDVCKAAVNYIPWSNMSTHASSCSLFLVRDTLYRAVISWPICSRYLSKEKVNNGFFCRETTENKFSFNAKNFTCFTSG